ncbi:hypothetical protein BJ742DRAFT_198125 [Cladochytrium replicatum]|nr:hypothetical protein BJ742DRAFT_198125 [Cladochytrium replicatum]
MAEQMSQPGLNVDSATANIELTKNCFAKTLSHPLLFDEFYAFANLDDTANHADLFAFYNAVALLETIMEDSIPAYKRPDLACWPPNYNLTSDYQDKPFNSTWVTPPARAINRFLANSDSSSWPTGVSQVVPPRRSRSNKSLDPNSAAPSSGVPSSSTSSASSTRYPSPPGTPPSLPSLPSSLLKQSESAASLKSSPTYVTTPHSASYSSIDLALAEALNSDPYSSSAPPPSYFTRARSKSVTTAAFSASLPEDPVARAPIPHGPLMHAFVVFYNDFIAHGAPHEVNIPSMLRRRIEKQLTDALSGNGKLQSSVFDLAVDEVLALMYRTTFAKWVTARKAALRLVLIRQMPRMMVTPPGPIPRANDSSVSTPTSSTAGNSSLRLSVLRDGSSCDTQSTSSPVRRYVSDLADAYSYDDDDADSTGCCAEPKGKEKVMGRRKTLKGQMQALGAKFKKLDSK